MDIDWLKVFNTITYLAMTMTQLILISEFIKMRKAIGDTLNLMHSPELRGGLTTISIDLSADPLPEKTDTSKYSAKDESSGEDHK